MNYQEKYLKRIVNTLVEAKSYVFYESKKLGKEMLTKAGITNVDSILNIFVESDKSKNQKYIPLMAYFYIKGEKNTDLIVTTVVDYSDMAESKKMPPFTITREGVNIGGKTFDDFIKFSEYVHYTQDKLITQKEFSIAKDFKGEEKALFSGDGIDVYDGTDVKKCINYGAGGLTGKHYSFCIGAAGGKNMFAGYRARKDSTFYYIVDRNKFKKDKEGNVDLSDPLHIIVFDVTKNGIELTDGDNRTGTIAQPFGKDVDKYVDYLKKNNVPVDKLVNKPRTKEEIELDALISRAKNDYEVFKNLSYKNKREFIARGHRLNDKQFDSLEGDDFLISLYADTGLSIQEYQIKQLTNSQLNSYARKRIQNYKSSKKRLEDYEINIIPQKFVDEYAEEIMKKNDTLTALEFSKSSKNVQTKYLEKFKSKVNDPDFKLFDSKLLKGDYFKQLDPKIKKILNKQFSKLPIFADLSIEQFNSMTFDDKKEAIINVSNSHQGLEMRPDLLGKLPEPLQALWAKNNTDQVNDNVYDVIKSTKVKSYIINKILNDKDFMQPSLLKYIPKERVKEYIDTVAKNNWNSYGFEKSFSDELNKYYIDKQLENHMEISSNYYSRLSDELQDYVESKYNSLKNK
jgi:hypothetical protein